MSRQPSIIISVKVGSLYKYLLNAPIGPDNKRRLSFTPDIKKARRFFDEAEAKALISRCVNTYGYGFATEKYQPAVQRNQTQKHVSNN